MCRRATGITTFLQWEGPQLYLQTMTHGTLQNLQLASCHHDGTLRVSSRRRRERQRTPGCYGKPLVSLDSRDRKLLCILGAQRSSWIIGYCKLLKIWWCFAIKGFVGKEKNLFGRILFFFFKVDIHRKLVTRSQSGKKITSFFSFFFFNQFSYYFWIG